MKRTLSRMHAWLTSMRGKAAIVGLLYIAATLMFFATMGIASDLIDDKNAQQTGINVVAHGTEFYWLYYTTLFGGGAYMAIVAMLHELLRPANARISRVATRLGVVAALVNALGIVFLIGVSDLLTDHRYKLAFVSYEYNALGDVGMMLFFRTMFVTILFLGLYGICVGYLTFKSSYLPCTLGAIVGLSGFAWVIACLPHVTGDIALGVLLLSGFVGPLALGSWLLVKGVRAEQWRALTVPDNWDDDPPVRPSQLPVETPAFPAENITGRPRVVH